MEFVQRAMIAGSKEDESKEKRKKKEREEVKVSE